MAVLKLKYFNALELHVFPVLCLICGSLDRLCGIVVRVLGYRSGGPVGILALPEKKLVGLERGALSLMSTTEGLLDRKVAAPV
jgi:hypothetical protein